jgi:hypothetical protein
MRSWHDFHITGYAIDGKNRELVFELEWPYDSSVDLKRARLEFSGVECYYLEHDLRWVMLPDSDLVLKYFLRQITARLKPLSAKTLVLISNTTFFNDALEKTYRRRFFSKITARKLKNCL